MIFPKLRSQAGASLIAALFLFLFCAMTGTVILTAASANAGRLSRGDRLVGSGGGAGEKQYEDERQYSRVISAAKLFADQIKGKKVTLTWTRTDTYEESGITDKKYSDWEISDVSDTPDNFSGFLVGALKELYGMPPTLGASEEEMEVWENKLDNYWQGKVPNDKSVMRPFTMELSGDSLPGKFPVYGRVAVVFQNNKCVITAVFSTKAFEVNEEGRDQIPPNAYAAQLVCNPMEIPPQFDPKPEDLDLAWIVTDGVATLTQKKTITLQWNGAQITEER